MSEKLQTAIAAAAFVSGLYAIYIGGTLWSGAPMPDGALFGALMGAIGVIFGYKFRDIAGKKEQ